MSVPLAPRRQRKEALKPLRRPPPLESPTSVEKYHFPHTPSGVDISLSQTRFHPRSHTSLGEHENLRLSVIQQSLVTPTSVSAQTPKTPQFLPPLVPSHHEKHLDALSQDVSGLLEDVTSILYYRTSQQTQVPSQKNQRAAPLRNSTAGFGDTTKLLQPFIDPRNLDLEELKMQLERRKMERKKNKRKSTPETPDKPDSRTELRRIDWMLRDSNQITQVDRTEVEQYLMAPTDISHLVNGAKERAMNSPPKYRSNSSMGRFSLPPRSPPKYGTASPPTFVRARRSPERRKQQRTSADNTANTVRTVAMVKKSRTIIERFIVVLKTVSYFAILMDGMTESRAKRSIERRIQQKHAELDEQKYVEQMRKMRRKQTLAVPYIIRFLGPLPLRREVALRKSSHSLVSSFLITSRASMLLVLRGKLFLERVSIAQRFLKLFYRATRSRLALADLMWLQVEHDLTRATSFTSSQLPPLPDVRPHLHPSLPTSEDGKQPSVLDRFDVHTISPNRTRILAEQNNIMVAFKEMIEGKSKSVPLSSPIALRSPKPKPFAQTPATSGISSSNQSQKNTKRQKGHTTNFLPASLLLSMSTLPTAKQTPSNAIRHQSERIKGPSSQVPKNIRETILLRTIRLARQIFVRSHFPAAHERLGLRLDEYNMMREESRTLMGQVVVRKPFLRPTLPLTRMLRLVMLELVLEGMKMTVEQAG
ncbi:hypothetical protein BLNAU_18503 [Blattamonas nauphoetae]|uniref:Uncharacterized protein n=1 Tax=Blattamonas nauphoetae TaxID=2049346 RepID=A0ABQ9X4H1_9EUKA|nr:hypothetical protein BLNAU_18503 [Blattamonas nauphoetae]